jgi:AcrR family transcriptional regulator
MPGTHSEVRKASGRAEATRRRILDAAVAEFAENGLAGTRVDQIAARAQANKRMIYAYYGSKENLWLTVLEKVYTAKNDEERALDVEALPPREAMAKLVSFNLRYTAAHPEFVALLNEENVNRAIYLGRSEVVRALYAPLLEMVRGVLMRGEAAGVFRKGVDPMQLYISLVGVGHFWVANRHTLSTIFNAGLRTKKALAAREAHCVGVILGYLRP